MSDGGLLGAPELEKMPQQQAAAEVDEHAVAEREAAREMAAEEQKDNFLEQAGEAAPTTAVIPAAQGQAPAPVAVAPVVKDEVTVEVERILEEGLGEYVPDMPEEARQRFLQKGGEVAAQLSTMVRTLNVQAKLVIDLIKEWLTTIPGVNRYFIEQEAKIKTDRIVELAEAHRQPLA